MSLHGNAAAEDAAERLATRMNRRYAKMSSAMRPQQRATPRQLPRAFGVQLRCVVPARGQNCRILLDVSPISLTCLASCRYDISSRPDGHRGRQ
jgi:hypothetical protein